MSLESACRAYSGGRYRRTSVKQRDELRYKESLRGIGSEAALAFGYRIDTITVIARRAYQRP